jgi:DNA-binding LacI/PurR family transcriptional regulator
MGCICPREKYDVTRLTTTNCLNVGLLIDWLVPGYQGGIIEGVVKAASVRGANLLMFFGGAFRSEALTEPDESVFRLAGQPVVDGVVAAMGTLAVHLGQEASARVLERLGTPWVSIGFLPDNNVNVNTDNCAGLLQLCEHLVKEHHRKNFAVIAGPKQSTESEERIRICRDTLKRFNLELSEERITHQELGITGGENGVIDLLDVRKIKLENLDALVCVNDLIAEGAIEELLRREVNVPGEIAVTGFDGLERSIYLSVPLTTVSQPLVDLGREAMRSLLQTLDGMDVAKSKILPSRLVIRNSCGCAANHLQSSENAQAIPPASNGVWTFFERRELVRASLSRTARGQFTAAGGGWEERWLMAILGDLRDFTGKAFLSELDTLLRLHGREKTSLEVCNAVLGDLRTQFLSYVSDPNLCRRFEEIVYVARLMIMSALERIEVNRRLETTNTLNTAMRAMERLIRLVGQASFWRQLEIDLVRLGIHLCCVSRYVDPLMAVSSAVFLFSKNERDWAELVGVEFPAAEILPGFRIREARDYPLVVRQLVHSGKPYGIVVFSYIGSEFAMYELLATVIALQLSHVPSNSI